MSPEELDGVEKAFEALVDDTWGEPTEAPHADLATVWKAVAEQGWLDLDPSDASGVLVRAAMVLGRHACPLPLADAYLATRVLADRPDLVEQISTGQVRPVLAAGAGGLDAVEGAQVATHVLVLDPGSAGLCPIGERTQRSGIAIPAWSAVRLEEAIAQAPLADGEHEAVLSLMRLFLSARGLAAAGQSHRVALEYAKIRKQFGRSIGSFGAIQQRVATGHIDLTAATALVIEAARLADGGSRHQRLASELAVAYIERCLPDLQLGAQHTFGAIGFFNEHECPWLFRRAHADLALLAMFPAASPADLLLERGGSLPATDRSDDEAAFRAELKAFFGEHAHHRAVQPFVDDADVVEAMAERGYFGLTWPEEYGGQAADTALQAVLMEEVGFGRVGSYTALNAVMFLSGALLEHGTAEQREQLLPLIRSGRLKFCLGYSEPETGSDLAALRTRAVRDDDDWVINGQKTWTTRANRSEWIWLATRTDPDPAKRHRGLTMFMLPLSTPGITITEHESLAGEVSCTEFFDDVRVPDSARIGGVDDGWRVINTALAGERVALGGVTGSLHAQLDDLLAIVREQPGLAPPGSAARDRIAHLAAAIQGARLLVRAAVDATASGGGSRLEAPMASVLGGELAEQFGEASLAILGPIAALDEEGAAGGAFSHGLLLSIKYVVGGGTNDVLRGVIARSLGLPRE